MSNYPQSIIINLNRMVLPAHYLGRYHNIILYPCNQEFHWCLTYYLPYLPWPHPDRLSEGILYHLELNFLVSSLYVWYPFYANVPMEVECMLQRILRSQKLWILVYYSLNRFILLIWYLRSPPCKKSNTRYRFSRSLNAKWIFTRKLKITIIVIRMTDMLQQIPLI